jgi:hypothetical protein
LVVEIEEEALCHAVVIGALVALLFSLAASAAVAGLAVEEVGPVVAEEEVLGVSAAAAVVVVEPAAAGKNPDKKSTYNPSLIKRRAFHPGSPSFYYIILPALSSIINPLPSTSTPPFSIYHPPSIIYQSLSIIHDH